MSSNTENELAGFCRFVGVKLSQRDAELSTEDVLDEWRAEHPLDDDDDVDDVTAVMQALADMTAGDEGIPLDEFKRGFRQRHKIDESR
jgi:hypothetical protein